MTTLCPLRVKMVLLDERGLLKHRNFDFAFFREGGSGDETYFKSDF